MAVQHITQNDFQKEVLAHQGVVFIDFFAEWCAPCKVTSPLIEELSNDPKYKDKVKFVDVDVDSNQELASQYNVFSIPTFVTIVNGEVKNQFSGARDRSAFEEELNKVAR